MRCDQVDKLLVEYADGELNAGEHAAVSEHVEACEACAAELAALERMKLLLREDGYEEPSSFYWTRFGAGLRERLHGGWMIGDDRWARLVPRLAPVVVAAAFFVVGMWMGLWVTEAPLTGGPSLSPGVAGGSYAELPAVSARSKLLVETGGTQPMIMRTASADTLEPEGLDPFGGGPTMILTGSDEEPGRQERYLGVPLMGE